MKSIGNQVAEGLELNYDLIIIRRSRRCGRKWRNVLAIGAREHWSAAVLMIWSTILIGAASLAWSRPMLTVAVLILLRHSGVKKKNDV